MQRSVIDTLEGSRIWFSFWFAPSSLVFLWFSRRASRDCDSRDESVAFAAAAA
jgi:hypothetical protein